MSTQRATRRLKAGFLNAKQNRAQITPRKDNNVHLENDNSDGAQSLPEAVISSDSDIADLAKT